MNPDRWQHIKSVFSDVLKIEPSLRLAYIHHIGETDPDLRQRIEVLLEAHENEAESDEFLRTPAAGLPIYDELIESESWVGKHIGPYELIQELGAGGMGEVYLGRRADADFEQRVAIKLIRSGQDSASVVNRFISERRILAGLSHPNIARLLDGGRTAQGQPYFVMEYVPGLPITQYCEEKGLSLRDRLELLIQACDGLQHAHQNAIIHRDLKPSNILVVEVDGKPVVRVIDFGLAKTTASGGEQNPLTKFGVFMGTPGYMSPEQADLRMTNIDTRTDVYSLGAILYVLLTGMEPFENVQRRLPPFDEWLRRLREDTPPRPSAKLREITLTRGVGVARNQHAVPADLDWITMKALERDRDRRYGTPVEFAADLRRYLRHEPVLARPPSAVYQVDRYVRRHRVAAAAVAAVVLALAVGMTVALWQARVARAAAGVAHARELEERAQETKITQMSALSAEQSGDAASQLGFANVAIARLAHAVRLDPDNPTLRSHLLQALEEQDVWWLPRGSGVHQSNINGLKLSPTADRLATGSEDGNVRLWDTSTGKQVGATMHHDAPILDLKFSPDGTKLVTASADRSARVWDAATGAPLGPAMLHAAEVDDATFSHDGTHVVTASEDHTARVWDWRTGRSMGAALQHHGAIYSTRFSADDHLIVTASQDHTARVWDADTGRPQGAPLRHAEAVVSAEFSPDGRAVVTASHDNTARVWDAHTSRSIGNPMKHTWVVSRALFSPDGARVMTYSWDRTVRIWDATSGVALSDPMIVALQVRDATFSPDGRRVFTVLQDGTIRTWDGSTGRPRGALVRLTASEIAVADFSSDGTKLATAARDGSIQVWDERLTPKSRDPLRQDDSFTSMEFSSDGRRIVTGSSDHTAIIWDAATSKPLLPPLRHDSSVVSASFSKDGTRLLTYTADHTVRVWNTATGELLGAPIHHQSALSDFLLAPDGSLVFTVTENGTLQAFRASTGQPRGLPLHTGDSSTTELAMGLTIDGSEIGEATVDSKSHTSALHVWDTGTGATIGPGINLPTEMNFWNFSPDGGRIVTTSKVPGSPATAQSRTILLWDVPTGARVGDAITSAAELLPPVRFFPDNKRIVVGTMDGTTRMWDSATAAPFGRAMMHDSSVLEAHVSSDGARILTASADQSARIWDASNGAPVGAPMRHDGIVWSARFTSDGTRVVTASSDHTVQLWDAGTHLPLTGAMRHDWPVRFALPGGDGSHIITISVDRKKMRLWPVLNVPKSEAATLADLAEAVGGYRVDANNSLVPVLDRMQTIARLRRKFGSHSVTASDVDRFFDDLAPAEPDMAP